MPAQAGQQLRPASSSTHRQHARAARCRPGRASASPGRATAHPAAPSRSARRPVRPGCSARSAAHRITAVRSSGFAGHVSMRPSRTNPIHARRSLLLRQQGRECIGCAGAVAIELSESGAHECIQVPMLSGAERIRLDSIVGEDETCEHPSPSGVCERGKQLANTPFASGRLRHSCVQTRRSAAQSPLAAQGARGSGRCECARPAVLREPARALPRARWGRVPAARRSRQRRR